MNISKFLYSSLLFFKKISHKNCNLLFLKIFSFKNKKLSKKSRIFIFLYYLFIIFARKNHSVNSVGNILTHFSFRFSKFFPSNSAIFFCQKFSFSILISIFSSFASPNFFKKSDTTISFSSGASVQVEYTKTPHFPSFCQESSKSFLCKSAFWRIFSSDQNPKLFSLFASNRPSAEHGASRRILSNFSGVSERNFTASVLKIFTFFASCKRQL